MESQEETKEEVTKSKSRRRAMVEESDEKREDGGADEGESNTDWWEIEGKIGRRGTALFSCKWQTIGLVM